MDQELQQLKRHDDLEAQAQYLNAAIRSGHYTPFRVELASFFGDPASQLIYPNVFPDGIPFSATIDDELATWLIAWAALKCILDLWEEDERIAHYAQLPVASCVPAYMQRNVYASVAADLMPPLQNTSCLGWPRFVLDCVEQYMQGSLSLKHLKWLEELHQNDIAHGPECMDRSYYAQAPIEDYIHAIKELLLHQANFETGHFVSSYLLGFWTTSYERFGNNPLPYNLTSKARAVYLGTRCLSNATTQALGFDFNDRGEPRLFTSNPPENMEPYDDFVYWQNEHIKLAAPYALEFLLNQ